MLVTNGRQNIFIASIGGGNDSSGTRNKSDHDAIYKHLQITRQDPFKANPLQTSHCYM